MKFDISYTVYTTNKVVWYTNDNELNFDGSPIEADSENDALNYFKEIITELMNCNCLDVENEKDALTVYEPSDHSFVECYHSFVVKRINNDYC